MNHHWCQNWRYCNLDVVCGAKFNDKVTRTSFVTEVIYNFEIPLFLPFTWGYLILAFDGMACRAQDGRNLIDCPVVSLQLKREEVAVVVLLQLNRLE